jgi:hypothetical protein
VSSADELTSEREEQLIYEVLRERGRIDSDRIGPVLDLAAMGLVNGAWRNTCVEDWHATGRLRDGDMLRINSQTTWRARQLMRRWRNEADLSADTPLSALDGIEPDNVLLLAGRLYRWLANPARQLPAGMTLAQLAGDGLRDYEDDAEECLGIFAAQAEHRGARFGFARTAAHGALACSRWWGHPRWPTLVEAFMTALDDPADDHWGTGGELRTGLPAEPAAVADRKGLRRLLLSHPWELSTESAQWLVRAGIGHTPV